MVSAPKESMEEHPDQGIFLSRTRFQAPEVDGITFICGQEGWGDSPPDHERFSQDQQGKNAKKTAENHDRGLLKKDEG